ncbi:autotransporter-associated beta strand repeat-containing protein, partial [Rhizobiaceae sp. 2RAB30]
SGTVILAGNNSYSGATEVLGGILRAGSANAFSGYSAFTVKAGAVLDFAGFNQAVGSLSGSGKILMGTGTLTLGGNTSSVFSGNISGSGGLVKSGSGELTLTGINTYTGGTTIKSGTLSVSSDANLGNSAYGITLEGGTLRNTAAFSTGRTITLAAGGGVLRTDADLTLTGIVSGEGGLTKTGDGTLTLTANNSYRGGTRIDDGMLQ